MNMTNELHIRIIVLSQVVDRSIITMQIKHCNRSSRITPTQIIILSMKDMI
jgi:hypothetical protein